MIIGLLGKGGSGKSTISYRLIKHLNDGGSKVLAVYADHNMDLTYNLGVNQDFNYMGAAQDDIRLMNGLSVDDAPSSISLLETPPSFSITPLDGFTDKYTHKINDSLLLMASGPHTDEQLYGQACSHWLTTSIKTYLPHLTLSDNEYCVVDERAGVDGVGTGMTIGWDTALITAEATEHGIKAANQIAKMVKFFGTPYEFILNKVREEDSLDELNSKLEKPAKFIFKLNPNVTRKEDVTPADFLNTLTDIHTYIKSSRTDKDKRMSRMKNKLMDNKKYREDKRALRT